MPDDVSVGRQVQAVRLARNIPQAELATRCAVSRSTLSRLECGDFDSMPLRTIRSISKALGMPPLVTCGWRLAEVEHLIDGAHAAVVEVVARMLRAHGWEVRVEYSFNRFGERGTVDVIAWHAASRTLLIIEVKSRIWDIQDTFAKLDRKRRLVPSIVGGDLGWHPRHIGVVLVIPDNRVDRRLIALHSATFDTALPERGASVTHWFEKPDRDIRGIWLVPNDHGVNVRRRATRRRARRRPKQLRGAS